MLKRLGLRLADLAVKQSRDRISRTGILASQSRELSRLTRDAIELSHQLMSSKNVESLPANTETIPLDAGNHLLVRWSEPEIEAFADALIETYIVAQERGDAEMEAVAHRALLSVGRYLANKIGPKMAGVTIN